MRDIFPWKAALLVCFSIKVIPPEGYGSCSRQRFDPARVAGN